MLIVSLAVEFSVVAEEVEYCFCSEVLTEALLICPFHSMDVAEADFPCQTQLGQIDFAYTSRQYSSFY
jgi:hypothetical protein